MRSVILIGSLFLSSLCFAHPDGTLGPHQHIEAVIANPLAAHLRDACIQIASEIPAPDAPWTDPLTETQETQCVTWFVKLGTKDIVEVLAERAADDAYQSAQQTATDAVNDAQPDGEIIPEAVCGDGITTPFIGEECDDAGESATCNDNCRTSVCGDGNLNVTAGEQCDDGNTDDGDGCDSLCQNEVAQADLPTDIHLAWDASPGSVDGYRVYFGPNTGDYPDEPVWEGPGVTVVIGDLEPCANYFRDRGVVQRQFRERSIERTARTG